MKCDSRDRERLIYIYLKQVARIFEKQELEILHIAPELNLAKSYGKPISVISAETFLQRDTTIRNTCKT